jgi:hypothetical protein
MDDFLVRILRKIDGDPTRIAEAFGPQLSQQEELMLNKLEEQIAIRVDAILDRALAAVGPMIMIDAQQKTYVMEMTAIRKAIVNLIAARGTLKIAKAGLN